MAINATIANKEPRTIRMIFFFICAESKISASGDYSSPQYNPFWPPPRPTGPVCFVGPNAVRQCGPRRTVIRCCFFRRPTRFAVGSVLPTEFFLQHNLLDRLHFSQRVGHTVE